MFEIIEDVKNGALPLSEVPGFFAWVARKLFWPIVLLATVGTTLALVIK